VQRDDAEAAVVEMAADGDVDGVRPIAGQSGLQLAIAQHIDDRRRSVRHRGEGRSEGRLPRHGVLGCVGLRRILRRDADMETEVPFGVGPGFEMRLAVADARHGNRVGGCGSAVDLNLTGEEDLGMDTLVPLNYVVRPQIPVLRPRHAGQNQDREHTQSIRHGTSEHG
jgi:hypothetical protein